MRITNRLRYTLKQYYPQVLEWFEQIDTLLFCNFINRWPTLTQVKRARENTLKTFFKFLLREGHVKSNPMDKVISPKKSKKLPSFVEEKQINNLLDD